MTAEPPLLDRRAREPRRDRRVRRARRARDPARRSAHAPPHDARCRARSWRCSSSPISRRSPGSAGGPQRLDRARPRDPLHPRDLHRGDARRGRLRAVPRLALPARAAPGAGRSRPAPTRCPAASGTAARAGSRSGRACSRSSRRSASGPGCCCASAIESNPQEAIHAPEPRLDPPGHHRAAPRPRRDAPRRRRRSRYAELDRAARGIATSLRARGIEPGATVAILIPNLPEFTQAYFGILYAGCTVVPLNVLLSAPEVQYHLEDSRRRAADRASAVRGAREGGRGGRGRARGVGGGRGRRHRRGARRRAADLDALHPTLPTDTAVILYTSGTTGKPKGAELTHSNLFVNCAVVLPKLLPIERRRRRARDAAALPLVRADLHPEREHRRRRHVHAAAALHARRRARDHGARPRHAVRGRPDDVLRAAPPRGPRARSLGAALVRLGRRGDAGRGDERVRGEVPRRDPRGLRPLGDLAGRVLQHAGPPAHAGLDRLPGLGRRDGDPRREGPAGRRRRARRDLHPRPQRDEGLPRPPRRHARGAARRLVPLGRRRDPRRERLLPDRRPREGHDHPRRLQRVPARDRGGALRAPGDRRGRGDRRPAREPRRGGEGGGRLARPEAHRRAT